VPDGLDIKDLAEWPLNLLLIAAIVAIWLQWMKERAMVVDLTRNYHKLLEEMIRMGRK
jgi:hypothetical protein